MEIPQVTLEIQIRNRKGPKHTRALGVFSPTADVPSRREEILRGLEQTLWSLDFNRPKSSSTWPPVPRGQPAAAIPSGRDPHGSAPCAGTAPSELPSHWPSARESPLPRRARVIVLPSPAGRRGGTGRDGVGGAAGGEPRRRRAAGTRAGAPRCTAPPLSAEDGAPGSGSPRPAAERVQRPPGASPGPFPCPSRSSPASWGPRARARSRRPGRASRCSAEAPAAARALSARGRDAMTHPPGIRTLHLLFIDTPPTADPARPLSPSLYHEGGNEKSYLE